MKIGAYQFTSRAFRACNTTGWLGPHASGLSDAERAVVWQRLPHTPTVQFCLGVFREPLLREGSRDEGVPFCAVLVLRQPKPVHFVKIRRLEGLADPLNLGGGVVVSYSAVHPETLQRLFGQARGGHSCNVTHPPQRSGVQHVLYQGPLCGLV